MDTQGNGTPLNITQQDKDAQWAREYYYRNREAVLAKAKARRDSLRAQDTEAGIARPGRGRPRIRVDVPKKENPQKDNSQGAVLA
jgi:hypothetical protein